MRCLFISLSLLFFALPALAGNWGENWGTMVWGSVAAVPTMGKLGVLVLALGIGGFAARAIKRGRAAASLFVIGLVLPMVSPSANAQTVPNTFSYGSVADADQVNANFEALRASLSTGLTTYPPYDCFRGGFCGVDGFNSGFYISHTGVSSACGTDISTQSGLLWSAGVNVSQTIQFFVPGPYSLPPCDEDPATTADVTGLTQFQNGTTAYADEINANFLTLKAGVETCLAGVASAVTQGTSCGPGELWDGVACVVPQCDVTVNNAAIYDGGFAAGVLSVDIRTDNGALCTGAGGTYDSVTNTCTVDITSDNETVCTQAGGTWNAGTTTCTSAQGCEGAVGALDQSNLVAEGNGGSNAMISGAGVEQTFVSGLSGILTGIELSLLSCESEGDFVLEVFQEGTLLGSATHSVNGLPCGSPVYSLSADSVSGQLFEFSDACVSLSAGTTYRLVISTAGIVTGTCDPNTHSCTNSGHPCFPFMDEGECRGEVRTQFSGGDAYADGESSIYNPGGDIVFKTFVRDNPIGNSCTVDITSDHKSICETAGGTWDAGTSTCTPAPAAPSYNCFIGGFCARAAIDYPPDSALYGYTNVYEGHTQGAGDALAGECNTFPGSTHWDAGEAWPPVIKLLYGNAFGTTFYFSPCAGI